MESSPECLPHASEGKQQVVHYSRRLLMSSLNRITDFDSRIQRALDENREAIQRTHACLATHERLLREARKDQSRIRKCFQEMEDIFNQTEARIEEYLDELKEGQQRLESRQQNLQQLSERNPFNTNSFTGMRLMLNEDAPLNGDSRKRPAIAMERNKASLSNILSDPEEDLATPVAKRPRIAEPDYHEDPATIPQASPVINPSFRLLSKPSEAVTTSPVLKREPPIRKPSYASHTNLIPRSSGSASPMSSVSSMPVEASPRPLSLNPRASFRVKVTDPARPHEFKPYNISNASEKRAESALEPRDVRTCRGCRQLGRRKDGKCIEKWGPGPEGPGTLCGRCQRSQKSKR